MTRRTQAERSASTRAELIDAAIGLLRERGWAATTAVAVCERAGVTRGALMHHYPNLPALLADALDSLYEDYDTAARTHVVTAAEYVDLVWSVVGERRFKAVLEASQAAGNDPELAVELRPVIDRFAKLVSPTNLGLGEHPAGDEAGEFALAAREAMLGLAFGRATNGGRGLRHEKTVLNRLRRDASAVDRTQEEVR